MGIAMTLQALNGQEFYVIVKLYMGCKYIIQTMNLLPFCATPYEWKVFFEFILDVDKSETGSSGFLKSKNIELKILQSFDQTCRETTSLPRKRIFFTSCTMLITETKAILLILNSYFQRTVRYHFNCLQLLNFLLSPRIVCCEFTNIRILFEFY